MCVPDDSFEGIDDYAFTKDPARDLYGPTPPAQAIAKILRLARQCEVDGHSEASWNGRIHTTLLDLALFNKQYDEIIDFLNW